MALTKYDRHNLNLDRDSRPAAAYTEIHQDFISSMRSYGDSLKKTVLTLASHGNFEAAKRELAFYQKSENRMPGFEARSRHYVRHCMDLLDAIYNLKNIPNMDSLRAAQQKAIRERIIRYAEDLSSTLGRVEKVTNDLRIQDIRSTLWVLRTFSLCIITLFCLMAFKEAFYSLSSPLGSLVSEITQKIFSLMGI